jgi:hypothetical protein
VGGGVRRGDAVPKYMVLYRSTVPATEQMGSDPNAAQAGMALWMEWFGRVGGALIDAGSPLATVATLSGSGATDQGGGPCIVGYSVLEAASGDAAREVVDGHPHFHAPGASIELLELLPTPGA